MEFSIRAQHIFPCLLFDLRSHSKRKVDTEQKKEEKEKKHPPITINFVFSYFGHTSCLFVFFQTIFVSLFFLYHSLFKKYVDWIQGDGQTNLHVFRGASLLNISFTCQEINIFTLINPRLLKWKGHGRLNGSATQRLKLSWS